MAEMFSFLKPSSRKSRTEKTLLAGREVEIYRKPYRRRLSITVKLNGRLRITAPSGISTQALTDFVRSHEAWIEKALSSYGTLRTAFPKKSYVAGEIFPYLGDKLRLRLEPSKRSRIEVRANGEELIVCAPSGAAPTELAKAIAGFYERSGRELITKRVEEFSKAMDLNYSKLSFRSQKTRWGSCSSRGGLSFNWRLMIAPREVVDYVVVHELSHLKHYNHSSRFWALVATQIPDYKRTRSWLSQNQYEADFLAKTSELHQS
ncbi:MAG: SprT family zinc-dependent metalloprotease [Bdellovibrionota bacterium]